jgi:hypothetical protein
MDTQWIFHRMCDVLVPEKTTKNICFLPRKIVILAMNNGHVNNETW